MDICIEIINHVVFPNRDATLLTMWYFPIVVYSLSICFNNNWLSLHTIWFNVKMQDPHQKLNAIITAEQHWTSELLFNEADPSSKEPHVVDLLQKISTGREYVFPNRFFGMDSTQQIKAELKITANQCGFIFSSAKKSKDYFSKCKKGEFLNYIVLSCRQNSVCDDSVCGKRDLLGAYKTRTHLSTTKQKRCSFKINVALRKSDNRWVLRPPQRSKLM